MLELIISEHPVCWISIKPPFLRVPFKERKHILLRLLHGSVEGFRHRYNSPTLFDKQCLNVGQSGRIAGNECLQRNYRIIIALMSRIVCLILMFQFWWREVLLCDEQWSAEAMSVYGRRNSDVLTTRHHDEDKYNNENGEERVNGFRLGSVEVEIEPGDNPVSQVSIFRYLKCPKNSYVNVVHAIIFSMKLNSNSINNIISTRTNILYI